MKGAEVGEGQDSKGKESKGKDFKGNDAKGKDSNGKDSKGKGAKGKDSKGRKNLARVEEDSEAARRSYSPHTAREQDWWPANCRNEYEYTQYWGSGGDWAYLDGR